MYTKTEEAQVSESTQRIILRETLEAVVATGEPRGGHELVDFASVKGGSWSGQLLVVGRFVNDWDESWPRQDILADPGEFVEKVLRLGPLEELFRANQKLCKYSRRSPFWLTLRAVATGEGFNLGNDWISKVAYSNLYRFGYKSGNPPDSLCHVQQSGCVQLLADEISTFKPSRILLLTGWDWAQWFLGPRGIPLVEERHRDGNAECVGTIAVGSTTTHVVVSKHPQGKKREPLVADIQRAFKDLEG